MTIKFLLGAATVLATISTPVFAHDGDGGKVTYATDHAPIGVMADHRHKKGEVMLSYRYMNMDMDGSRVGTNPISTDETVTTIANPFAGPPTLRVVPTRMTMEMHMFGVMYGLTDRITLLAMGSYNTREMDHITYQGGMGTTQLGEFTTESSGLGDTTVGAIVGLDNGEKAHRQVNLGLALSLPTGSISEEDDILTPMGTTPTVRLPYPMQLGSGTFDFKPNLTAFDRKGKLNYGAQLSAVLRLGENSSDYTLDNIGEATAWVSYEPQPWIGISARAKAKTQGVISGQDPLIAAPVQTAVTDFQGGDTVELLGGINLAGQSGALKGHRLALEVGLPVYRNLNGPQLETDLSFTLGWQKAFK